MSTFILTVIPELADYPILLVLTSIVFLCFFGGFVFSAVFNMITGLFDK